MELKDAIAHYKERARTLREFTKSCAEAKIDEATKTYIEHCLERAECNEQTAEWLAELAERRQADEWILVGKRKPDIDEEVLVCYRTQGGMAQMVSYRMDNGRWWGLSVLCCKPVAWKPLGEPYKRPYTQRK